MWESRILPIVFSEKQVGAFSSECHSLKHTNHLASEPREPPAFVLHHIQHAPRFWLTDISRFLYLKYVHKGSFAYDTLRCLLSNSQFFLLSVYVDQHSFSYLLTEKWQNGNILFLLFSHGSFSYFDDLFSLEMSDVNFIPLYLSSCMLDNFTSLPTQMCFLVVQRRLKN